MIDDPVVSGELAALDLRRPLWLVIADTRWQMVNIVPAALLGLDQIDHVLFLRGTSGGRGDSEADRRNSIAAHKAVRDAIDFEAHRIGRNARFEIHEIKGDKDDLHDWANGVFSYLASRSDIGEVVYVYTGGTKDMSLGTQLGLEQLKASRGGSISVRLLAKHDRRVHFPFDGVSYPLTSGANRVHLETYLRALDYARVHQDATAHRSRLAGQRVTATEVLGAAVLACDDAELTGWRARHLNWLAQALRAAGGSGVNLSRHVTQMQGELRRTNPELAGRISAAAPSFLKELERAMDHCPHARVDRRTNDVVVVPLVMGKFGLDHYLDGDWFEEWIWLRASKVLAGSGAEVLLGVAVAKRADSDQVEWMQVYDIDVAIFANDQLHVVECKSGRPRDGKQQVEREHVAVIKSALVGPYGRTWLARLQPLPCDAASYEQAAMTEIGLMAGKVQLEDMISRIARLVR